MQAEAQAKAKEGKKLLRVLRALSRYIFHKNGGISALLRRAKKITD